MNKQTFQIILFKVGEKFLNYILNLDGVIFEDKGFSYEQLVSDLYGFNQGQVEVLEKLNSYIQQSEFISAQNPNTTIKLFLLDYGNIFNEMRRFCGGDVLSRETDSKFLNFLLQKATEYYPSILISDIPKFNSFFDDNIMSNNPIRMSRDESELVFNLFREDTSLSKFLYCMNDEHFSSFIRYQTENHQISCYVFNFVGNFLLSSFQNCCYRTQYSLEDFLNDIELQYYNLVRLANNEVIDFSYFTGIYGLRLDGVDEFKVSKNVVIRNINEKNNPCAKNTISIGTNQTHIKAILGCVLEYKTNAKLLDKNIQTVEINSPNYINAVRNNFQTATILALQTIRAPFSFTFSTDSIPLSSSTPIHTNNNTGMSILSLEQLFAIKEWYEILEKIDLKFVDLTIHRIKSAIYNREYHIDSILDAFIAWESMFSSEISTTKSVTKSIEKILQRAKYEIKSKKLNDLYALRSSIVHGNPKQHELIKSKDPQNPLYEQEKIKEEVISIALTTLKVLVKDKELIEKTPRQRVEYLLAPTTEVCEKCESKKYRIEKN